MTIQTDMYISKELLKIRDNIFFKNDYINIFALGKLNILIGALIDKNINKTQDVNNALDIELIRSKIIDRIFFPVVVKSGLKK